MYATTTPAGRRIQVRNDRNEVVGSYALGAYSPECWFAEAGFTTVRVLADGVWEINA